MRTCVAVVLSASVWLAACSPALNWRQASLEPLQFMLPCKPDKAQRNVPLAGQTLPLDMLGCEADGALFAVSRVTLHQPGDAAAVVQAWRQAALAAARAGEGTPLPLPLTGQPQSGALAPSMLRTTGKRPNGEAVQIQLAWVVRGANVFHLAAYAEQLTAEMTEPFFSDLKTP